MQGNRVKRCQGKPVGTKGRKMVDYFKLIALAGVFLFAAMGANFAHDLPYQVNAIEVMIAAAITFIYVIRNVDEEVHHDQGQYLDSVIRAGVIATAFWGIVGFLVGVVIAFQLAFPALNIANVVGNAASFVDLVVQTPGDLDCVAGVHKGFRALHVLGNLELLDHGVFG